MLERIIAFKHREVLLLIGVFVIFKLILITTLEGKGWEADSYQHYIELDTVYKDFPQNLGVGLSVWSKPLYTYILGILTSLNLGLIAIQVANLVLFAVISYLAYLISYRIYKSKLVGLFSALIIQLSVILFKSSITGLTEPLFTLTLIVGLYLVLINKPYLASLAFGLSVLGRIEGLLFLGIYGIWVLVSELLKSKRDLWFIVKNWLIGILPAGIWTVLLSITTGELTLLIGHSYPTSSVEVYGNGSWLDYFLRLSYYEPIIILLFTIGAVLLARNIYLIGIKKITVEQRLLLLTAAMATTFFLSQVITWRFGLFGSAGLMRYFVSILPLMVIVGGVTLKSLLPRLTASSRKNLIGAAILLQFGVTVVHFAGVGPFTSKWIENESLEFQKAGEWIQTNVPANEQIGSLRPEVVYYANRDLRTAVSGPFGGEKYYVWESSWGEQAAKISLEKLQEDCTELTKFNNKLYIFLCE